MNRKDNLHNSGKKVLPIDTSNYEYNYQPFENNVSVSNDFQNDFQSSSPRLNSSLKYNQFISDTPLYGSSGNENKINSRFNQAQYLKEKHNFTFLDEEENSDNNYEQQQSCGVTFQDNFIQKPSYENIAFQAQQLLDKLNHSIPTPDIHPNELKGSNSDFDDFTPSININKEVSRSVPSLPLQPILRNARLLPNRSSGQILLNKMKYPNLAFTDQNQYQSNFNDRFMNLNQFGQDHEIQNIPHNSFLNHNSINEMYQSPRPPQPTFASPSFLSNNNFDSNAKRLNTASEMVYPDNHIEFLHHSYGS